VFVLGSRVTRTALASLGLLLAVAACGGKSGSSASAGATPTVGTSAAALAGLPDPNRFVLASPKDVPSAYATPDQMSAGFADALAPHCPSSAGPGVTGFFDAKPLADAAGGSFTRDQGAGGTTTIFTRAQIYTTSFIGAAVKNFESPAFANTVVACIGSYVATQLGDQSGAKVSDVRWSRLDVSSSPDALVGVRMTGNLVASAATVPVSGEFVYLGRGQVLQTLGLIGLGSKDADSVRPQLLTKLESLLRAQ
jgi:hypothetical protein